MYSKEIHVSIEKNGATVKRTGVVALAKKYGSISVVLFESFTLFL